MGIFLTWYESEKAERIEDILDEREMDVEMLPTPDILREQDVMICKDCFQVIVGEQEIWSLSTLGFPANTKCFTKDGELKWEL